MARDENVGDIREGREVGNHASETHLLGAAVNAEAERIFDRAHDGLTRNSFGPIRAGQKTMNRVNVEVRSIGADEKPARVDNYHCCHVPAPRFPGSRYSATCAGIGFEGSSRESATAPL